MFSNKIPDNEYLFKIIQEIDMNVIVDDYEFKHQNKAGIFLTKEDMTAYKKVNCECKYFFGNFEEILEFQIPKGSVAIRPYKDHTKTKAKYFRTNNAKIKLSLFERMRNMVGNCHYESYEPDIYKNREKGEESHPYRIKKSEKIIFTNNFDHVE